MDQSVFSDFVNGLEQLGYHVCFEVVDCSEYGMAQKRHRLVLLASKLGPIKLLRPTDLKWKKRTVRQAISKLPPLVDLVPNVYPSKRERLVASQESKRIPLIMKDSAGVEHEYTLKIEGWIGTYIHPFRPEHPLNDDALWQTTNRDAAGDLSMDRLNADIFCQKIEAVCDALGYIKKTREENLRHLETIVAII